MIQIIDEHKKGKASKIPKFGKGNMSTGKPFFNIVPSILLRGVDPLDVLEKYHAGYFQNLKRDSPGPTIRVAAITFAPISDSVDEAFYTFKDKNGQTQVLVFENQQEYKAYLEGKEIKRRCDFCMVEFTHEPERIPIKIEERYLPSSDAPNRTKVKIVWGIKKYCNPIHCWTAIQHHLNLRYRYRDVLMQDSDILYKNICKERFPNLILREIPLELCAEFNGPIDQTTPGGGEYTYKKMSSFIVVPVKIAYERRPTV